MRSLYIFLLFGLVSPAVKAQLPADARLQTAISYDQVQNGFSVSNAGGTTSYRFQQGGVCSETLAGEKNERSGNWTIRGGTILEMKFKRQVQTLQVFYFYGYYFFVPLDKSQQFLTDTRAARNEFEGKAASADGKKTNPAETVLAAVRPKYYSQLPVVIP